MIRPPFPNPIHIKQNITCFLSPLLSSLTCSNFIFIFLEEKKVTIFMEHLLLLLCCFFLSSSNSIHGVSSLNSDGSTLLSLLRHLNSVPPSITSTWNSSDPTPCSWLGVQCDNSSFSPNVVSLKLSGLAISGKLGSEISQLTHLQILDLSNNSLYGEIPFLLGNSCRLLQSLDLSMNAFTGQIPHSFKFLQRLTLLSLYSNSLSGKIPQSLFGISSLEYVYLNNNNFSGSIPDNVGNLSHLLELWLYGNRLSGTVPDSIGNCSRLEGLYLNENLLGGSLPNSLTNLKSLLYLYLHHNNFHGSIPSGFGNCKNLSVLDLSFNGFSGGIPPDLGNSSSLTELVMADSNLIGSIPSSLGLLNQLSVLDLSENRLSGRIPPELGKCRSLTSLKLYRNQLEGEIPGELGMLTELQDLELFTNQLSGEIPISIWRIPSLEYLLVYNNSLSGELPPEMTELKQLKNISLYENQFSGVIPRDLGISSSLLQLDFTNNKFTGDIPPNLCSGKQLRVLNMGRNQLEGSIPSDVGQCPALWRLILKENNLTGPLPEFVENPSLEHIDISTNTISGSLPPTLGNSTSLTYIDFSMNNFSGSIPPELGNLVKLEFVDLSHNQLNGPLPSQLSNCFKLGYFDVGFNSLNGSIPSSLKNWTKLYTLSLRENRFTGGIPPFVSEFEMLTELQMGGNLLGGEIPSSIGSLQGLQYALNLSSNQLNGAIPSTLGNLIKLERLDISNNNLTGSLAALHGIRTLMLINISQNHFTGPIPGVMMNLLKSSPSSFLGNPGLCVDCTLKCTENGHFKSCATRFRARKDLGRAEIALVVLLSVVAVFILGLACVFTFHRRRKKDVEIAAAEEGPASLLGKVMEATENLSDRYIIGRGSHGTVYKASLSEDELFAVKRIAFSDHKGGNKSMIREVQTIGKIKHRNLIRLEQFWLRKDYGLILYSYMENGSLHEVLHGKNAPSASLEWILRYRIAIGTANALAYLHYDCDPPIVHRDIKPENILLDLDMEPHISDFGIAKLLEGRQSSASENSSIVMGTLGYIAPENAYTTMKSKESDVYSYGVVLLELITRKQALDPSFSDGEDIVKWCRSVWCNTQDISDIIDSDLAEEFYDSKTIVHVTNVFLLALRCTESEPSKRPTMRDVVRQLVREDVATRKPLRICSTG